MKLPAELTSPASNPELQPQHEDAPVPLPAQSLSMHPKNCDSNHTEL